LTKEEEEANNPPTRHLRPHLHPPELDTRAKLGRQPGTLYRINNAPGRGVADGATRARVAMHVKHPLSLVVRYIPIIRRREIKGTPGGVVDGRWRPENGGVADVVGGEGRYDVEEAVLEERVVLGGGGHVELAVSV